MQLIKAVKKTTGKIEQVKTVVNIFCLLSDIKLSDSELTVISYFIVYQSNEKAKELILKSNILKSSDSLKNTISKLKRIGLLKKSPINKEYTVHERLKFNLEPVIGFLIKIDNN